MEQTLRQCKQCNEIKVINDFYKDKKGIGGYRIRCKECVIKNSKEHYWANPDRARKVKKEYRNKSKDKIREEHLKRKFNLTREQYYKKLEEQNNVCAICNNSESHINKKLNKLTVLCVDHNHITDNIRGLLCRRCNTLLGIINDNKNILSSAINYLQSKG